jgi:hypothetical protein
VIQAGAFNQMSYVGGLGGFGPESRDPAPSQSPKPAVRPIEDSLRLPIFDFLMSCLTKLLI